MEQIKKHSFWTIFFSIFVAVQIVLIFAFNLFHLKYVVNFDSSAAMAQAMEIWKQKTIFLSNWSYQSTLGLDSMIIPASIFYGITKNIFLAYGIADCLGVILYLGIFYDTLKTMGVSRIYRLITYVFLLTPYSLEPLGYMPMMFTNASYYIIKVLIPVILIDIMLKLHKNISVKKFIPLLVFYGVSIVLTAFSSGVYLLICGIFPIMLFEIYLAISSGNLKNAKNKQMLLLLASVILYACGYAGSKLYGADVFTSNMVLCQVDNVIDNFSRCIVGLGELFGAVPGKEITITSYLGIHYLSHIGAFLIFVIIAVQVLVKNNPFKYYFLQKENENTNEKMLVTGMVCMIFVVNALVLFLTNTTYGSETYEFRYHLIPVVSGFLLTAVGIEMFIEFLKSKNNELMIHSVLAVMAVVWLLCNVVFVYYFNDTNEYNRSEEICSIVRDETEGKVIYFIGDDVKLLEISRIARLLSENEGLTVVDAIEFGYFRDWGEDNSYYRINNEDNTTIICSESEFNNIPANYQKQMSLVTSYGEYNIYYWKRN